MIFGTFYGTDDKNHLENFRTPLQTALNDLPVEELLHRVPVELDPEPVKKMLLSKRVLVTGAAGSIGFELCKQILAFRPAALIMLDRSENGLFTIRRALSGPEADPVIRLVVGDVTDTVRMNAVVAEHRPQIVFHAAAYKHVALMEENPCEAVKNNVGGTYVIASAAITHRVERFVLISTDKAVNPCSVMGATKRIAELIVRSFGENAGGTDAIFSCVRFGNVLASNGSVVPIFWEQIRHGGPLTITHPDVRRYFMLISEAVQLVLHAGAIAHSGDILVLRMGNQIKIVDLAQNMIRLAGFIPGEEIPITFVGLRPGEKISEELLANDETGEASGVQDLIRVRSSEKLDHASIQEAAADLVQAACRNDTELVVDLLSRFQRSAPASSLRKT